MGTFDERTRILEQEVGSGKLITELRVHQPYAADEHNKAWYSHPRGGRYYYVQDPFFSNLVRFMYMIGRGAVTPDGSRVKEEMINIAKIMIMFVFTEAPVETNVLRRSGSVVVTDNGSKVYGVPQQAPFIWEKT